MINYKSKIVSTKINGNLEAEKALEVIFSELKEIMQISKVFSAHVALTYSSNDEMQGVLIVNGSSIVGLKNAIRYEQAISLDHAAYETISQILMIKMVNSNRSKFHFATLKIKQTKQKLSIYTLGKSVSTGLTKNYKITVSTTDIGIYKEELVKLQNIAINLEINDLINKTNKMLSAQEISKMEKSRIRIK